MWSISARLGRLTSKPYAFNARPWELKGTESVDVMDGQGCNIRVDTRGREVLRVLPRLNEEINEEWISDKARHACDGLSRQRLDKPYVRKSGKLMAAPWAEAFAAIAARVAETTPDRMAAVVGDLAAAEEIKALKDLMTALGVVNLDCRQDGAKLSGPRPTYLFNTTIAGVEAADALLLIGTNPRWEAPVLNARIRKTWLIGNLKVANIGGAVDLTYPVEQLGADVNVLDALADGSHAFATVLKNAKRPMLIVGSGALARPDGAAILKRVAKIALETGMIGPAGSAAEGGWNGFNILHTAASRMAALDLGFVPGKDGRDIASIVEGAQKGEIDFVYSLGADEFPADKLGRAFVVYQGSHGDVGAHYADVVLPGAAYTEKDGLYVNFEGRVQEAQRATFPPGEAKEDWAILRALSDVLGKRLPYDNREALCAALVADVPHFGSLGKAAVHAAADAAIWNAVGVGRSAGDDVAAGIFYRRLLPHQSHRTGQPDDGGMQSRVCFRRHSNGGGVDDGAGRLLRVAFPDLVRPRLALWLGVDAQRSDARRRARGGDPRHAGLSALVRP